VSLPPPESYDNPPPSGSQPEQPVEVGRIEPQRVAIRLPDRKPIVTYAIMAVTILVFIAQEASQLLLGDDIPLMLGAKVNSLIQQGEFWRFFTPALLHANLVHILFNMYALYVLGRGLERHYGHTRFFLLYIIGAFAGNVASFWMSTGYSVGASTAIFALVAAQGVFVFQNRAMFGAQARGMLMNVLLVVALNLFLGLQPGIDNWGHLGGLISGVAFAWFAGPLLKVEGIFPDLHLDDQRSDLQGWTTALLEAFAIAAIAAVHIINK
jgi:rhomboid protease GluP